MAFKVFAVLALTLAVAAAAVQPLFDDADILEEQGLVLARAPRAVSKDQSITIGAVYAGYDRQLLATSVIKKASFLTVNSVYLTYPQAGQQIGTISCIQIVDLEKNGKNAVATVQSGGIGQRSVNIKFKSQRGEGIKYMVIIWGH